MALLLVLEMSNSIDIPYDNEENQITFSQLSNNSYNEYDIILLENNSIDQDSIYDIDNLETVEEVRENSNTNQKDIYDLKEYQQDLTNPYTGDTRPNESMSYQQLELKSEADKPYPTDPPVYEYKYGRRVTPAVDINIPTGNDMRNDKSFVDTSDTSKFEYLGEYKITGYTPGCAHCCGNARGITASGVKAIPGYTVATTIGIPFGTTLYIKGYGYYVVEDRGAFNTNIIDIAAPSHADCYPLTDNMIDVYIVHHD